MEHLIFCRDLPDPERRETPWTRHQVRRRVPREAHQADGQGRRSRQGAPKGYIHDAHIQRQFVQ